MRITIIGGGVGCARFTLGVREWARRSGEQHRIDVVVNTADDWWVSGLRITPDHDSLLYALAGVNDTERGWGRAGGGGCCCHCRSLCSPLPAAG